MVFEIRLCMTLKYVDNIYSRYRLILNHYIAKVCVKGILAYNLNILLSTIQLFK